MAYTCTYLGKPIAALEYLEQARAGLDSPDRFLLQANELTTLAASVWKGDVQGGLEWYARLRQGSSPYLDLELMSDVWLGYLLFLKGELVKGTEVLEQVRAREKKLGCLAGGFSYLRIQSSIYLYSRYAGKLDRAREELSVLRARETVDTRTSPLPRLYASWIALEAGDFREVVSLLEGVPDRLENGVANRLPYALNTLAEAWLRLGEPSRAEETARRSVGWNTRNGNTDQLIWALRIQGLAFLHQGRRDLCRGPLLSSSALARTSGMPPHVAWGLSAWADYHHARGNGQKARACLEKARALWLAMGCPFQAERMREKLALLSSG